MKINPYQILQVSEKASFKEIKSAYRKLVKKYHPDKGGDEKTILNINAAWEILKSKGTKDSYDKEKQDISFYKNKDIKKNCETVYQADSSKQNHKESSIRDLSLALWIKEVYMPIDRLVYEIISPFSKKLKELSADPYDDYLMNSFCNYIDKRPKKK